MADIETQTQTAFFMDRSVPLGNSNDKYNRRALHTLIGNSPTDPVPVEIVSGSSSSLFKNYYNEVTAVASGIETIILTYTATLSVSSFIQQIDVSGENIATYQIKLNGVTIDKKRSYFTKYNETFLFNSSGNSGWNLTTGDIITVTVLHNRPDVANFNSTLKVVEV